MSSWIGICASVVIIVVACSWILEIPGRFGLLVYKEQFLAMMLSAALVAVFVTVHSSSSSERRTVPWYDWLLAACSVVVCGYVVTSYPRLAHDLSSLEPIRIVLGLTTVLLILEGTRRLFGWTLVAIALFVMLYAHFGDLLPGVFHVPSSNWRRIVVYTFLDANALFGIPLDVAANMVTTFILFGAFMKAARGDAFITGLALLTMGRFRGGPAKVSVIASTLFGTISGSTVANIAVVGPITIPMMEQAGYRKTQAAAIEAVASTGGQIMPPVMGITAFLMADFLAIPYSQVVMAALLPALLYYVAVFVQVDLEAAQKGLQGVPREVLPSLAATLKSSHIFVLPLLTIIYTMMVEFWSPGRAGLAATAVILVVQVLTPGQRPTAAKLFRAFVSTGRTMADILVLTAMAGIIIGGIQLSGLGFALSSILPSIAGSSLLLTLLITGIFCVILGMALPTAVIYTTLAVIIAPALVQLGMDRIAAHFFLFYMGMLSMITPPVCFATFTSSAIAGSSLWPTALRGMQYGFAAYIIPFILPFSPGLLMQGTAIQIGTAFLTATVGVAVMAMALVGFLFRRLHPGVRMALLSAGMMAAVSPFHSKLALLANVVGMLGAGILVVREWLIARRRVPVGGTRPVATAHFHKHNEKGAC